MATKFLDLTGLSNYDILIKQWVKALTDGLKSVSISKVDSLPEVSEAKQNVIYFVPAEGADSENTYDEYILVDGAFELIGTTRVSLDGYAQQTWVTQQITAAIAAIGNATGENPGLMSSEDKAKLDSLQNYTHPSHGAHASGLYKVTVDALGHVTAAAPVEKQDITALGIPAQDTTYAAITESEIAALFD